MTQRYFNNRYFILLKKITTDYSIMFRESIPVIEEKANKTMAPGKAHICYKIFTNYKSYL